MPVPTSASHELIPQILDALDTTGPFESHDAFPQVSQADMKAALDRLSSRSMVQYKTSDTEQVLLTAEGKTICDEGSHEYKVYDAVRRAGKLELNDLPVRYSVLP